MPISSVFCVTLVLSSVRPDCFRLRERRNSAALLSQSAYNERQIPLLIEEETPLPSNYRGDTQKGRRSHKPTLED
jgi:hypothetical protein